MSQAITNAAKAEVGLDRRIMQSYPLIYQSSAPLNESNAQISRGAEKNNIAYLLFIRCGHVVRDFESEAKTRCNFQF